MKKINKFGVITCPSTYIGCNNITTFFFLFFESLPNLSCAVQSRNWAKKTIIKTFLSVCIPKSGVVVVEVEVINVVVVDVVGLVLVEDVVVVEVVVINVVVVVVLVLDGVVVVVEVVVINVVVVVVDVDVESDRVVVLSAAVTVDVTNSHVFGSLLTKITDVTITER